MVGVATLLQVLNLSNNKLKSLPDEISKLAHLREICIAFNKFEDIPSCIYRIQNLEILIAENNQVPTFFFENVVACLLTLQPADQSLSPPTSVENVNPND